MKKIKAVREPVKAWALWKPYETPFAINNNIETHPMVMFRHRYDAMRYKDTCAHHYEIIPVLITEIKPKKKG